jgi:hypothetical protein
MTPALLGQSNSEVKTGMITADMIGLWILVCLLLAVEHWFEWPKRLHRLVAYIIGTSTLNIPFTTWLVYYGSRYDISSIIVALWGNIFFGGATVLLAWGYDAMINNYARRKVAEKEADVQ